MLRKLSKWQSTVLIFEFLKFKFKKTCDIFPRVLFHLPHFFSSIQIYFYVTVQSHNYMFIFYNDGKRWLTISRKEIVCLFWWNQLASTYFYDWVYILTNYTDSDQAQYVYQRESKNVNVNNKLFSHLYAQDLFFFFIAMTRLYRNVSYLVLPINMFFLWH